MSRVNRKYNYCPILKENDLKTHFASPLRPSPKALGEGVGVRVEIAYSFDQLVKGLALIKQIIGLITVPLSCGFCTLVRRESHRQGFYNLG